MTNDSDGDEAVATDDETVVAEETVEGADADEEPTREIQLIEDETGFWTLVDSERGAIGDAPTKAAGLALMEQVLEEMDDVTIPDVEPEEPSDERPARDPKLPPEPSMPDDEE